MLESVHISSDLSDRERDREREGDQQMDPLTCLLERKPDIVGNIQEYRS